MRESTIPDTVARLRAAFDAGTTRPIRWRLAQLERLKALCIENEARIADALKADFGKCAFETWLTEIASTLSDVDHALKHLKRWARPRKVATPISNQPGGSSIVHEPLGVVLIIAPWNYPFLLQVGPLVGAVAAGNCALLKPSELTPRTSALLADLVPAYLDPATFAVVEGGADVATDLLDHRFDHVFYTGSGHVGRIVMRAAAEHLTPVTLELGGKSPCIVADDADLAVAARRIAWGKYLNAGQTCVAPDYVLAHPRVIDELVPRLESVIRDFYGTDPRASPDYARIVNERHFDRLVALLASGKAVIGGASDRGERYIAPTVLTGVAPDAPAMQEEIFGPILPLVAVSTIDDAMRFVNARDKPLALYLFTKDDAIRERVVAGTSSGGVCVNDVVLHLAVPDLPFGGVGASGMGSYHGHAGFLAFSHAKSVLAKSERMELPLRYPPYTGLKSRWLRRLA
ncbi:MAG: aldehyde dehydrogenase family protein [Lautropia sp.]